MRAMFIGLLFTSAVVLAQTPGKVGYQGRLSNADGTPAQGVVQMRFELFAAASGGTALWGETQTIALSDGLYSTFLGEVTALPDTVFDGSERFLELTVGTTTLSPRQRVASVPYALVARDPRLLVSCADGEVLKWSTTNSRWACAPDDGTSASTLANYVTIASLTSTLSGYPTNASLTTTLAGYPTNASLTTALAGYVTSSELTTTLSGYPTNASLTTTLAGYVTNSELTTTLAGYPTNASLTTTLSSYPTNMALATALSGYVSTSDLSTALASYPTNASLTATLAGYVSTTALDARLSSYALASSLPTSVDGLAGGTITSAVTVSGALGATSLTQNGNAVCDVSGNCGATLGAFNPASACSQNQVLQWTGTAWGCTTIGGSTPSQPCTGAGQALQWDGTTWTCINVQNSGLSGGRANGFETRDDWGDVWDGVPRAARTWAEANQACSSAGARLPTVTELWRNRATYGTGNIGTPNDTYPLWTIAPSYRPNYYATTVLSNGAFTDVLATNSVAFRCIWKSQSPSGLSGNRCFGPPGAECRAKDAFYNVDRWSRAPQFFPSAKKECELENASIATAEDLEAELGRGANFVSTPDLAWPAWHFTASSSAYSNGYLYSRLLRWTKNPEPWWGPDSTSANFGAPTSVYTFRCVGKKTAGSGVRPASPACQGSCFEITGPSRNRLIADNADRPAAVWHVAFKACQAVGGTLPTMEEINQLVHAGWGNGVITRYLWSGSPATWGWQVARWDGTGSGYWNPHHDYSNAQYSGTFVQPATATQYRCVWREARAASFLTCPRTPCSWRTRSRGSRAASTPWRETRTASRTRATCLPSSTRGAMRSISSSAPRPRGPTRRRPARQRAGGCRWRPSCSAFATRRAWCPPSWASRARPPRTTSGRSTTTTARRIARSCASATAAPPPPTSATPRRIAASGPPPRPPRSAATPATATRARPASPRAGSAPTPTRAHRSRNRRPSGSAASSAAGCPRCASWPSSSKRACPTASRSSGRGSGRPGATATRTATWVGAETTPRARTGSSIRPRARRAGTPSRATCASAASTRTTWTDRQGAVRARRTARRSS